MPTISVLVDARVEGLGNVDAATASVDKLGASATAMGSKLDATTGQLNASGAAHAAVGAEAQALGADLEATASKADLMGAAHAKATTATTTLSASMGTATAQAEAEAVQADALASKMAALEAATVATGQASATTGVAMQDLAAANVESTAAVTSSSSAMATSSAVVQELAVADGNLVAGKRAAKSATEEESGALEKAKAAHEAHAESVLKGVAATGEFGEAGVAAGEKLSALSGILGGAGGVNPAVAGLVVGLGAAVAVAKSGIESYNAFGESVLQLQHITGMTAESSSKMVDVFGQVGLGADLADKAMFSLAHRTEDLGGKIPKTVKTLQDLGVELAYNKDGSVDLTGTLTNVAGAYAAAGTGADKDAIAYAAFGKAGQSLIPVLEQGSAGLRLMSDQATRVFDQQQLEQVKQYNIEMAKAGQSIDKAKDSVGGPIVQGLGSLAQGFNDERYATEQATAAVQKHSQFLNKNSAEYQNAYNAALKLAEQSRKNAEAATTEASAQKALNDELAAQEQDKQDLLDSDNAALQSSLRLERSAASVANAQKALGDELVKDADYANKHQAAVDKVTVAQDKYNTTVKAYGPASLQAKTAQDALNAAQDASKNLDQQNADAVTNLADKQLTLKDAMLADSIAAVTAAEKTAELSGAHLSAAEQAHAQAAELQRLKDQAGGALPAELQALLDKLNAFHDVNVSVTANVAINDPTGFWGANHPGRAVGGAVEAGKIYKVGESGPEWMVGPPGGGYVYPHGVTPPGAAGGQQGNTYNITIQNAASGPPLTEARLAAMLNQYAQLYG